MDVNIPIIIPIIITTLLLPSHIQAGTKQTSPRNGIIARIRVIGRAGRTRTRTRNSTVVTACNANARITSNSTSTNTSVSVTSSVHIMHILMLSLSLSLLKLMPVPQESGFQILILKGDDAIGLCVTVVAAHEYALVAAVGACSGFPSD